VVHVGNAKRFKSEEERGVGLALLVERLTLDFGSDHDLGVVRSSPVSGFTLNGDSG